MYKKDITILIPVHRVDGDYKEMLTNAISSVEDFHNDVIVSIVCPTSVKNELGQLSDKLEINIIENKNTTGKKTLTDLEIDSNKFTNFADFKKHTEKIITDIMALVIVTTPITQFTIESFNKYIIDKIDDKRCKKPIPNLNTKYPILIT